MNSNKNKAAQLAPLNQLTGDDHHHHHHHHHHSNSADKHLLDKSTSKTALAQQEEALMMSEGKQKTPLSCCSSSSSTSSAWFGQRCLILLSMTLTLIITAILVAMLTISLLDQEDTCYNNYPFQQYTYKLFSTKTAYTTAYNLLNPDAPSQLSASNYADQKSFMLRDQQSVPLIFSKSESLKSLHESLTRTNQQHSSIQQSACKLRQFHYFGRHAARYPSANEIDKINRHLGKIQARIDLSKFSSPTSSSSATISSNQTSKLVNFSSNNQQQQVSSTNAVCFNPLAQYKQWSSFFKPDLGNLILESGVQDTQAIALRLKSIYPELFDKNLSKIEIGVTEALRTGQTALVFLKQINNFNLPECNSIQLSAAISSSSIDESTSNNNNHSQQPKVDEVEANPCIKSLNKQFFKEKLQFHMKCQSYHKELFPIIHNFTLKDANRTKFISASVSKKLKLTKEDALTAEETNVLYKICEYESALLGSSIWCNLFSENELKFYEYLNDIDDFFNQAYGHPDQARSACPITTELIKSFKSATRASGRTQQLQPEAHFYFTHSQVIQKILAASVDLEQDPEYSPKTILAHLQAGTVPKSSQWRTSMFTPFSANLAFSLYECPKKDKSSSPTSSDSEDDGTFDFDTSESPFKVVASLNEQPIQLDGCSDFVCDLRQLLSDSRINKEKRCKLEDICKKEVVVT